MRAAAACVFVGVLAVLASAQIELELVGTYRSKIFGKSTAEVPAYHAGTRRLFVVNAGQDAVDIIDVSKPWAPKLVKQVGSGKLGGSPNSVTASPRFIAVAVEDEPKVLPGRVTLLTPEGDVVDSVLVGALPDMLTFAPGKRVLLAACEGEPADDYSVDPPGIVSIIDLGDLLAGAPRVGQHNVTNLDFTAFDDVELDPAIRVFGPGATPSMDFEPEYIAVPHAKGLAYVGLQENNALALVDWRKKKVLDVVALGSRKFWEPSGVDVTGTTPLPTLPSAGTTIGGQVLSLGGLSGLAFLGVEPGTGRWLLRAHPDRGPVADAVDLGGDALLETPFALPERGLEWLDLAVDPESGAVELLARVPLVGPTGAPLTGLPNRSGLAGLAGDDGRPVDLLGAPLATDALGLDPQALALAPGGITWMADAYRPSLTAFDASGKLLVRLVPAGSNGPGLLTGLETLPAVYGQRRLGRGFAALVHQDGKLFAFMASALDNPDTAGDGAALGSRHARVLVVDPVHGGVLAEHFVELSPGSDPRIDDAVGLGDDRFLILERDGDGGAVIQHLDLNRDPATGSGATDLSQLAPALVGPGGTFELTGVADLAKLGFFGVHPGRKSAYVDLGALGLAGLGPLSLAFVDRQLTGALLQDGERLLLLPHDGWGLAGGFDPLSGVLALSPGGAPLPLVELEIQGGGLDASDLDGRINIRPWPVLGLYQPDSLAAFRWQGSDYLVCANEGDVREWGAFDEQARVKDLPLDASAFPDRFALRTDERLGRLNVSKVAEADPDGDFDIDLLTAFGTRSVSVRDATGALLWDSGDLLERVTAATFPAHFNIDSDQNVPETRSDTKGPEPEGLAVARLWGRPYAFVGLERIGGCVVLDLSEPAAPRFVTYINNRDVSVDPFAEFEEDELLDDDALHYGKAGDLGPEGLIVIPAQKSPTGKPLLVICNEVSGTTSLFAIRRVKPAPAGSDP